MTTINGNKPRNDLYSPGVPELIGQMRSKGQLQFFMDVWQDYGDLAHMKFGSQEMFLVVHPDAVRHVTVSNSANYDKLESYDGVRELLLGDGLVASRGDLWRRQRRLMAPFFTPRAIEQYLPVFIADTQAMIDRWNGLSAEDQPIEMGDEMMLLTAAVILHTMFSTESSDDMLEMKAAVETMIRYTASGQQNPIKLPRWMPTPANRRYFKARELVHTYIDTLLTQRRAMPEDQWPDDLLSKMMLTRDVDTGEAMSDSLLRDESITIFFAGHETTARTLTFMFYALSQNPQVERRMVDEITGVLGDRQPTADDLKRLPYTLQVVKETLRLYPAAPLYARDVVAEDEINGVSIPGGVRVMPFPYATHRHPDFWPDPERFDPDRWTPEAEAARNPYAFHPFAAGKRICLGNNFSLLESHVIAAMLVPRFQLRLAPGHQPQVAMAGTITSKNGMPMLVERR
ncbi:MAG: cytochrome P450 [Anaerolineae bacterium]|nr:cytochrome P450 [Anaerolineae bacterium]